MRIDLGQWKHYRGGKFGRIEQSFESDVSKYLDNIKTGAMGYYRKVADFTTKKSGLLDTEKVKKMVESMVESPGDYIFKDDGEKQFYYSFMYCALVLCSLDFAYIPPEIPELMGFYTFKKTDLRKLVGEADILQEKPAQGAKKGSKDIFGFPEYGLYDLGLSTLYKLLSGKELAFDSVGEDFELSDRELKETDEDFPVDDQEAPVDLYKELKTPADPNDRAESKSPEPEGGDDGWDDWSKEEIEEENRIEADKIKAMYPGFEDYVTNLETFKELFSQYASVDFFGVIKEMVGQFLVEGGFSIYNNEAASIDLLIQLKKASNIVERSMYGRTSGADTAGSDHETRN